jgi:ribosomal protein L7/L12
MAAHDSRLAFCDTSFAEAIRVKMAEIQRTYNVTDPQRPSLGDCSGPQFSLFDKGVHVSAVPVATQSKHLVVCPSCGFRNVEEETFRCRVCGRDHLCHRHYDEVENCCADCALKCKAEREEAQRKRRVQNNEQYGRTSIDVTEKFSVVIRGFGVNKPSVLKELQKFYRVSLSEIKRSFQSVPAIVMRSVSKDDAERCKFQLENVGADVAIGHDGFFDEMFHGTKKRKLFDNEAVYIITVSAVLLGGTYVLAKLLVWWLFT